MTEPAQLSDRETVDARDLLCSFCGKTQHQVGKLIAGPAVFICDECVGLCSEICGYRWVDVPPEIEPGKVTSEIVANLRLRAWELLDGWGSGSGDTFKTWNLRQRMNKADELLGWAVYGKTTKKIEIMSSADIGLNGDGSWRTAGSEGEG